MSQSKIFCQNRALGYVSNEVPHVTRYIQRRKENFIVTCVGKCFHTYGYTHFTLISVSGLHPSDIICMAADNFHVYTASEKKVYAWRRGNELKHTYAGHESPVCHLLPYGPHLLSVDADSNVKVWDIKSEEVVAELNFSSNVFKITKVMHPATYINKILFASEQGQMQLWNIKSVRMIYTFKGWDSMISALEQSPAVHVAAIGLANGRIILHNLQVDQTVFELFQDWGFVTSITFRSDGHEIMLTGSLAGHIVLWDLNKKKVESQIFNAHCGPVTGLTCFPNEALIVSSSPDNSLKIWTFDQVNGAARLLKIREGYAKPPTFLRFHGNDGDNIITSGEDSSFRVFSTVTEIFNKSLGRASHHKKSSKRKGRTVEDPLIMSHIIEFALERTREKCWDDIVAIHHDSGVATTWWYDKLKMGQHKLLPEKFKQNHSVFATSLCLTQCGSFTVIGYNTGDVERFNVQSGIHRASYGVAHKGSVTGVTVDSLNTILVTAGKDATLNFWSFVPLKGPITKLTLPEPIEFLRTHRESSIIALASQDYSTVLVDMDTRRIVRKLSGHSNVLTDATFSPDARWLITASRDCTIRTWDIPSGNLIDVFQVPKACKSLDFSPAGEYLATAHVDNLGIYLWINRTLFSHVSLKAIHPNARAPIIPLPGAEIDCIEDAPEEADKNGYESPEQLNKDLVSMSSLANLRWQNLLDLEIVKKRNKPKEPPKKLEAVPFFLSTIPSLEPHFDFSDIKISEGDSRLRIHTNFQNLTVFGEMLLSSIQSNDFLDVIEKLKSLGPSAIDFEVKSLAHYSFCSVDLMLQFMKMIRCMLESKQDFELLQAYLAIFLKSHSKAIAEEKKLLDYITELKIIQQKMWRLLREKLFYSLSIVQYSKKI